MNARTQTHAGARLRGVIALLGVLFLAACASTPPAPFASLQAAKQAISNAERADAGRYAAEELNEARTQLASADTAVAEQKMLRAERLADQSRVEADLASAKTASAKANAMNDEMKSSTATLIEEMQRNSGDKP